MSPSGMIARPELVLASSSPQRRALLQGVGVEPTIVPPGFDETPQPGEKPRDLAERLAVGKAQAVAVGKNLTVGADTVVVCDDEALGKPADDADAARMLGVLAGRSHQVTTGVAVVCNGHTVSLAAETTVWFKSLTDVDLGWYLSTGEWEQKAGAYAIQGKGGLLIDRIDGDYNNVVGLPLGDLDQLLGSFGRPLRTWMSAR